MQEKLIELQDYIKGLSEKINYVRVLVKSFNGKPIVVLGISIDYDDIIILEINKNGDMPYSEYIKLFPALNDNLEVIKEKVMEILKDVN